MREHVGALRKRRVVAEEWSHADALVAANGSTIAGNRNPITVLDGFLERDHGSGIHVRDLDGI